MRCIRFFLPALLTVIFLSSAAVAQSVCLPAPRLLTTFPMGGKAGSTFEVTITGEHLDEISELSFSHPGITARPASGSDGQPVPNRFIVAIAEDCPTGLHEARVMTRLGISSSRIFSVGSLPEVIQTSGNTTLDKAMELPVNSVCNAAMTARSVDFYRFDARQGQRIVIECAAQGIDSKLKPVLIVADADGSDLQVERRGGSIDFSVPETGSYVIKVHELTYNGGPHYFYRLIVRAAEPGSVIPRPASTRAVNAFSWPPHGLAASAAATEVEPNNDHAQAQTITLPCDLTGRFFPAADVDTFEFQASAGDVWWVEVASERFGLTTDPSIVVQHVSGSGGDEMLTDVAELSDIPSPVKVSSNGYSYDGPPYNAGSTDILGRIDIKQDGIHRLRLRDLFGGTRNDPRSVYRLVIRKAQPDFALVAWALHMNLRNGDRNALSKPLALRGGTTMPLEVVAVRRDGFDGEIRMTMDNLPDGVTATGLTIPPGQNRGIMLLTADQNAPHGMTQATFTGRAEINGQPVTRRCHLASMAWPVTNAWSEIPSPRLLADVPVSVSGSEFAPLTIAASGNRVWEATVGQKLTIPLTHTRRMDFSGSAITLKTFGAGFEQAAAFEASLTADTSEAVLDLAKLKPPPGEYTIAFYGSAVARYRYHPEAVAAAESRLEQAREELMRLKREQDSATSPDSDSADAPPQSRLENSVEQLKAAEAAVAAAEQQLKAATAKAKPRDIVDIVVSTPVSIRVRPAEETGQP